MESGNVIGIIVFFLMLSLFFFTIIQLTTKEEIGTERVKCIDRHGAEFEDEWCEKSIYCYKLSFTKKDRCGSGE